MLSTIALEALIILILIGINGILSMTELSILSSRRGRLKSMADAGDKGAAIALQLRESPDRMLSTVQIGITLMGILSGVFGGATVPEILTHFLVSLAISEAIAEPLAFGVTVLAITYLSLVLGELVPKRIALRDPESVARRLAPFIATLSNVASPLVSVLGHSTHLVLKLFRMSGTTPSSVSEEEVKQLIDEGTRSGIFEQAEKEMVGSIFRLSDLSVKDLMTPRTAIDWLDNQSSKAELLEHLIASPHSYFPAGNGSVDDLIGIVKAKDFMQRTLLSQDFTLREIARPAVLVPETATAFDAFEALRSAGLPFAVVVDEYGGVDGLITHTDLLTAIIGETEEIKPYAIVRREDGSYLVDAMVPIDEFFVLLGRPTTASTEQSTYRTTAGFVLDQFGYLPRVSDHFIWNGYRIEVVDLDGNRIDKILVSKLS